jgi:predicted small secreted protein
MTGGSVDHLHERRQIRAGGRVMRRIIILFVAAPLLLAGCFSFGKDTDATGTQAFEKELADMLRSYRQCLEKYEGDPGQAKEKCEVYRKTVYDLAPKGVTERREKLVNKERRKD